MFYENPIGRETQALIGQGGLLTGYLVFSAISAAVFCELCVL